MIASTIRLPVLVAALLAATPVFAHTGVGATTGFVHGLEHPIFGLDHLLAMVAVGLWAGLVGGRALWAWPLTFVAVMVAGALAGMVSIGMPLVEPGIIASVIVLGAVTAFAFRAPVVLGTVIIAVFALFHGHAHGTEAPADVSGLTYIAGFAIATAALHLLGLVAARAIAGQQIGALVVRSAGAAVAVAGIVLAAG